MKHFIHLLLGLVLSLNLAAADPVPHKYGWKSSPNHSKNLKQFVHNPAFATPILAKTDLSTSKDMPAVYDQGQLGSCTANAILAAYEFAYHQKHGSWMNGSRLGLYYDERVHDGSALEDAGSSTASGLFVLAGGGVGTEKCWPYKIAKFAQKPCPDYYVQAKSYTTITAYDVNSSDHVSIRKALSAGYPVIFGGYVYQSIENLTSKDYFNPPSKGRPIGGHERLIVGHDDNLTHTYSNGKTIKGYYWVRNSWNTTWGFKGHSWEPMSEIEDPRKNEDFAVISVTK